ncbi:hypothetical protein GWO43_27730 [candidate division KSB1 bacterium]|nr:hypothetical protein [candidate division KSB1 bacterium]NIX74263.1 hypothetical protein [candidate division KSB1 bacterium]
MKILIFILILYCITSAQQNENSLNISKVFKSKSGNNIITYIGSAERGNGMFFHGAISDSILIFEGYLRYGLICNWITDNIAEIEVPTGSTNFHSYFYNYENRQISRDYNLGIAIDTLNMRIACLDMNKILFYDIFEGSVLFEYHIDGLEPMAFLVYCQPKASFDLNGFFHLKYNCKNSDMISIQNAKDEIIIFPKNDNKQGF